MRGATAAINIIKHAGCSAVKIDADLIGALGTFVALSAPMEKGTSQLEYRIVPSEPATRLEPVPPKRVAARVSASAVPATRKRRLLFYTHALTHGGAERVMAMLASAMADAGNDVFFAVDHITDDHGIALSNDVKLVTLGGSHLMQLVKIGRLLKDTQPDWILSALASSNAKMSMAAVFAGMSKRHILSWHGFPQAEPSLISQIGYAFLPLTARLSAHQVCVSDALLAHMRKAGVPAHRSSRIYNPVDMAGLDAPAERVRHNDAPVVLSAGRLAPVKDFPTLVRAFAQLPHAGARLIILGEGSERKKIEAEARSLGVADRVTLPGHVHDMRPWFSQADVFVLPSLSESFSNVVVEALSFGLPVVATDCGGPREILDGGRFGALIKRRDARAMSRAIAAAFQDDGSIADLRRARAQNFSLEVALQGYCDLLQRLEA